MINNNAKETIRARLTIESVVGSYVKLEKSGKNFRACCPFHNEKSPSFYVTPDKAIYYCFGCHKGGDIFQFIEEIEGVPFKEALVMLASRAGVSLDDYSSEKPSRSKTLIEIMNTAAKHYEVGLRTHPTAVEYLLGRGMTKETMVSFRVGYAEPGWDHLYTLLKKKYSDSDILATGLCLKSEKRSGLYDRFRERIMFPIMDAQGRVIAFTGRVLPGTEEASRPVGKYINSPETELYHKSQVLFGFDKAKASIHTEGFIILVEGQMDCIMSHQVGVTNVVAISGTACTEAHMHQIKRFTERIVVCLDADNAGLAAAQKTAQLAYEQGMQVLAIDLGEGNKDPADVIMHHPDSWKTIIGKRKDFITFRLEKMRTRDELHDKIRIAQTELFPLLALSTSHMHIDDKLKEIAHAFGQTTIEPLRKDFEQFLRTREATQTQVKSPASPGVPADKVGDAGIEFQITILKKIIDGETLELTQEIIPFIMEWERQLGSVEDNKAGYERLASTLELRHTLEQIESERKTLERQLLGSDQNPELLAQIQELSRRRDTIIHKLMSH